MLEAPYFYDKCEYTSVKYDYGWHKLDGGKRWVCHHCADHGYAPLSTYEPTFEEWQEQVVRPQRQHVRELIKTKDPAYYNECCFYDDPESVDRYYGRFMNNEDEEN